jgi:hypothetical protein
MSKRECVYVVGAGFSAGLGYPLTHDLLMRLWDRPLEVNLKKDLEEIIRFHHPSFRADKFTSFPNIEELLSEMYVNNDLFDASRQYEGNFTREKLQNTSRDLLLEITAWFHELSKKVNPTNSHVKWLNRFRDNVIEENAAIISFNWDLVIDQLLFHENLDGGSYGFSTGSTTGPILLKPHGSLNWFEHDPGKSLKEHKRMLIHGTDGNKDAIYAFLRFREPVSKEGRIYNPLIVPPVLLKNFKKPVFKALWRKCTSTLSTAKKVVFLGYSMPTADLHVQFIMRCGFHNQVKGELARGGKRATATGPAEVVIVNPDRAAALRIAAVVGPKAMCRWVSTPVADWVSKKS